MTYEYMRGNGTGQAKNETLYTYDALNRLVTAHDNYGNSTRVYTYDSLGNLTLETGLGSHNTDYIYNNLNQQVDRSSDNWKTHTASTYDKRGNLILEQYGKNKKLTTAGAYTYDETNRMVDGVNGNAEHSIYAYNGLGALMEQTWIIAKNGYGYHDVDADVSAAAASMEVPEVPNPAEEADIPDAASPEETAPVENETPAPETGTLEAALVRSGNNGNGNNGNNGNKDKPTGSDVKKTSTVVKQFVVDFSREDFKPLMEHEINGLDYRYVNSDKARLSVVVQGIENGSASLLDAKGELHAYYHTDYLGTTDYLTSAVNSKIISWTSYSEWGEITHNAVLKCGQRELDLVKEYATHDFDAVLNMYYAKARFYDADNRRFAEMDPILDPSQYDLRQYVKEPMALVQYLYVRNNAVIYVDVLGEYYIFADGSGGYYAKEKNSFSAGFSAALSGVSYVGTLLEALWDAFMSRNAVGGNSVGEGILSENTGIEAVKGFTKDSFTEHATEIIGYYLGDLAKDAVGTVFSAFSAAEVLSHIGEKLEIPRKDAIVFGLFKAINFEPTGKTIEEVESVMTAAYAFVEENSWFFLEYAYGRKDSVIMGTPKFIYGPTTYHILKELNNMKDSGETEKEIQNKIDEYMKKYYCGSERNDELDNRVVKIKEAYIKLIYQPPYAKPVAAEYVPPEYQSFFKYALSNYSNTYGSIIDSFRLYMQAIRQVINVS